MDETSIPALQDAIRNLHGCESTFVESVPVVERVELGSSSFVAFGRRGTLGADTIWKGAVCVFDLKGHKTAKRAFAWSSETPGTTRRRFVVVLQAGPVVTPVDAVRASIVEGHRRRWTWDD